MGNVLCETEAVSDGALAEPMKNCDNKSVDEAAEPGNNSDAERVGFCKTSHNFWWGIS